VRARPRGTFAYQIVPIRTSCAMTVPLGYAGVPRPGRNLSGLKAGQILSDNRVMTETTKLVLYSAAAGICLGFVLGVIALALSLSLS
jgi:hypothetical protein